MRKIRSFDLFINRLQLYPRYGRGTLASFWVEGSTGNEWDPGLR